MIGLRRTAWLAAVGLGIASWSGAAMSQPKPRPTAERQSDVEKKKQAGREFRDGVKAFKQGKFAEAAEHFEKANEIAPNDKALWNAAESREKAGDLPRAARLYQRFLDTAPPDHKDRSEAETRLTHIGSLIGRIELDGQDATDVSVDGETAQQGSIVYVDPGDHVVRATLVDGKLITKRVNVKGGTLLKVALEPPKAPAPVAAATPASEPGHDVAPKRGWSPTVFYVGVAVTGAFGVATVASGLDTQSKRRDFDAQPSAQGYDDGVAAQKRTNLLLGATALAGVATAAVGVFAVRWNDGNETTVSLTPSDVRVRVRF